MTPVFIWIGAAVIGLLIGMVGIGGILLAPMLVYLAGLDLHLAMATSSWSFLLAGIAGTIAYARKGSISWPMVGWLSIGIVPAAILGARTNVALQSELLTLILAALIIASGIYALVRKPAADGSRTQVHPGLLVVIGIAVGFGSALTGTGGPVLLLPILVFLSVPALTAIGVSQVVQLPIAMFASLGFYLYGEIDLQLGVALGLIMAVGVLAGAQISHRVSAGQLRRIVALVLVGVGLFMLAQVFA